MSKSVLIVDYISSSGHKSFNTILIDKLENLELDLTVAASSRCINHLNKKHKYIDIPELLFFKEKFGLLNRFFFFLRLKYLKSQIDFSSFDYVIFSSYDELSLLFSFIDVNALLINHNNVNAFQKRLKRIALKLLSKKHKQIVFDDLIKQLYVDNGINDVVIIPHGLPKPFLVDNSQLTISIIKKFDLKQYQSYHGLEDIRQFENLQAIAP